MKDKFESTGMLMHPDTYKALHKALAHVDRWNRKLFTGYGLNILFPVIGSNAKKSLYAKHIKSGNLY